jgi:hypothetical protein
MFIIYKIVFFLVDVYYSKKKRSWLAIVSSISRILAFIFINKFCKCYWQMKHCHYFLVNSPQLMTDKCPVSLIYNYGYVLISSSYQWFMLFLQIFILFCCFYKYLVFSSHLIFVVSFVLLIQISGCIHMHMKENISTEVYCW